MRHYDLARVPLYVIVDGADPSEPLRLFGFERVGGRFRGLAPDAQGRLWLPPVQVWLGIVDEEVVCFDEAGTPIGDFTAQVTARQTAEDQVSAARAQADAEARARAEAEARIQALEAELARLRAAPE
ncbi:MAG: hypothetical protein IT340_14995 [Chloroflexi bacterium]|nr:hypothetical protein [Chloroflexota bacterium]